MSLTFAQDIQGSTERKDVHSDKLKRRKQISPNYITSKYKHVFWVPLAPCLHLMNTFLTQTEIITSSRFCR